MAGLLKEIRDLPTANSVTAGLGDYLHIKQGDVDRKITVGKVLEPHTSILSGNPHNVTKAEVGLGLVTNDPQLKIASNLSDVASVQTARDNLNLYSRDEIDTSLSSHTDRTDNPHNVTKAQVGLSLVTNNPQLKIASNLSDLGNVQTARTNLKVYSKSESDSNLNSHTNRTDNPHNVTKSQVGLSLVTNNPQLKIASNLSDLANVQTARTNLSVYSKSESDSKLNSHTNRTDNPHNVTKSQVGLGSVQNYGVSSSVNLNSSSTYATSRAVKTVYDLIANADTSQSVFKRGMIMMWDSPTPPAGWELLTAMNNRFPVGAGSSYNFGSTGGLTSTIHNHSFSGHNTTLSWRNIPPHQHASWGESRTGDAKFGYAVVYGKKNRGSGDTDSDNYMNLTSSRIFNGNDDYHDYAIGHSHGGTIGSCSVENRPPYYGVYFIRKL